MWITPQFKHTCTSAISLKYFITNEAGTTWTMKLPFIKQRRVSTLGFLHQVAGLFARLHINMGDLLWILKEISNFKFSQKPKWRCLASGVFQLYWIAASVFYHSLNSLSQPQTQMENWSRSHCSRKQLRCFHSHLSYFYKFKNPHSWSSNSEPRALNCHWKKTFNFRLYSILHCFSPFFFNPEAFPWSN